MFFISDTIYFYLHAEGSVNMGSAYYGHAGRLNGVKVDSYMYTDGTNTAYFSMTQERTCLPIVETAYGSNVNGKCEVQLIKQLL